MAAETLRSDPKYLGAAVRISNSGKNGTIRVEPKPSEVSGADTDIFTVFVEGASKNRKLTRADLTFPRPPMPAPEELQEAPAQSSFTTTEAANSAEMAEAEEAQRTSNRDVEARAAVEASVLSQTAMDHAHHRVESDDASEDVLAYPAGASGVQKDDLSKHEKVSPPTPEAVSHPRAKRRRCRSTMDSHVDPAPQKADRGGATDVTPDGAVAEPCTDPRV